MASRFKFGGKELSEELGLNTYDFGARNYDPALGRWMNIDPLAEQMSSWSPYNYAFNNPVVFTDPDGMAPTGAHGESLELCSCEFYGDFSNEDGSVDPPNKYQQYFRSVSEEIERDYGISPPINYGGDGSGSFLDYLHRFVYETDQYNPIAIGWDLIENAITGSDRRGNKLSNTEANLKALSIVPIGKVGAKSLSLGFNIFKSATRGSTFYRAMGTAEYNALKNANGLTYMEGKELFVSSSKAYSQAYLSKPGYDVLVKFNMKPGAMNYFNKIGVMHRTAAGSSGWAGRGNLLWKSEQGIMNLGIQSNTHLFNLWINSFKIVK